MAYSHTDYFTLRARLAELLGDTGKVFFTDAELGINIIESLRTWGALTGYWRERGTLSSVANTAFYSLQTALLSGGTALVGHSVTDRDIIQTLQYRLMEPATSQSAWNGTSMFTLDDLRYVIQRCRDQFLLDTGCVVTHSTMNMPAPPIQVVELNDSIIDVRRAVWKRVTAVYSHLWRVDEMELTMALPGWSVNPAVPYAYSVATTRPVQLRIAPPPIDAGTLDLVTVNSGAGLDPAASATVLGIPDSLSWVIVWGALAVLLDGDGEAADPARAAQASRMYDLGVEIAKSAPVMLHGEINGMPMPLSPIHDADAACGNWQNDTGTPADICIAGPNMIALRPVPDGAYGIVIDVVRNAPIPALDNEYIQAGREYLDAILGYASYLAAFKQGGAEFATALPVVDEFIAAAKNCIGRTAAAVPYASVMTALARYEDQRRPRMLEVG